MALRVSLIHAGYKPLDIPSNPYPMYPYKEVLNYVSLDSATGHRYVFANGPVRVNASIAFKNLDYEFVKKYEEFILKTILEQIPFKIICPEYIDFGKGKGIEIEEAYYAGPPTLLPLTS